MNLRVVLHTVDSLNLQKNELDFHNSICEMEEQSFTAAAPKKFKYIIAEILDRKGLSF